MYVREGGNLEIKTLLSMKSNYGSTRSISKIKYIVLHYTGNKTDRAISNCNYFKNNNTGTSAHYFVDKTEIYQSVPDNYVAWHCGGKKYPNCASTGGGKLYGIVTNANSIGIEMCSDNGQFHKDTLDNAEELVRYLMKKYNIPVENITTHFQVSGKSCPAYWVKGNGFEQFISRFKGDKTNILQQEKDDDLFNAVSMIIKSGIKLEFNSWKRKDLISKNIKNVPILLDRLGGLDKLIKDGIISDKTLWQQKKYNENHVRSLLIKYASKLK